MARTVGFNKQESKEKTIKPKGDNISTYLRKVKMISIIVWNRQRKSQLS